MEIWNNGNLGKRKFGKMEIWKMEFGKMEIWKNGNLETLKFGKTEIWKTEI